MEYEDTYQGMFDENRNVIKRLRSQIADLEAANIRLRAMVDNLEEGNWPFEWEVATEERERRKQAEVERDALLTDIERLKSKNTHQLNKSQEDEHICPQCGGELTYYTMVRCIECVDCGWTGQSLRDCATREK